MQKIVFQLCGYIGSHNIFTTQDQQSGSLVLKVKNCIYRFSLIEILMVIALMAMLFTMFMQFLQ